MSVIAVAVRRLGKGKTVIRRRYRQITIGDMKDRITLHNRSIVEPDLAEYDFKEDFSPSKEVWASINTTTGKTLFTGVNVDVAITHEVHIRYDPCVTSETWLEHESVLLDIAHVEDFEERHEFMSLLCVERGPKSVPSAQA